MTQGDYEAMSNRQPILTGGMNRTEYMDWIDFLEGDIDEDQLRLRQEDSE